MLNVALFINDMQGRQCPGACSARHDSRRSGEHGGFV